MRYSEEMNLTKRVSDKHAGRLEECFSVETMAIKMGSDLNESMF
jgi:hypothetical protein